MQQGISVWLDVPVEALAQRITAVGTDSRPLLHYEEGDAYTKVNDFSSMTQVFSFAKYKTVTNKNLGNLEELILASKTFFSSK